jgi:hypothetical protein
MRQVLSKWRGHGNTERHFPDFDIDAKFTEDRVDARIEVPDRHSGAEPERLGPAVSGPHDQGMIDEVDGDIERCAAMVEAACRQAADVYVQRDVPPVVARCRCRQPDLAEDLAVQMQCVFRCTPVGQMQFRQGHGLITTNATLSR